MIFLGGFTNNIIPVLVHWLQEICSLSPDIATLLQSYYFTGYLIMGVPCAFLISRFGHRCVLLSACKLGLLASTLALLLPSQWLISFFITVFILACAITSLRICALPYLAVLKNQANYAHSISFYLAFDTIGAILAPLVSNYLLFQTSHSWIQYLQLPSQASMLFILLSCCFSFALLWAQSSIHADAHHQRDTFSVSNLCDTLRDNDIIYGFIALFLFVGVEFGVVNALIYHIYNILNYTHSFCLTIVSFYWTQMLLGRILVSSYASIFSDRILLLAPMSSAFICCIGYFILPADYAWYALLALGACNSSLYPSIYGVFTRNISMEKQHYASCICLMATSGGALIPLALSQTLGQSLVNFVILGGTYLLLATIVYLHTQQPRFYSTQSYQLIDS